MRFRLEDVDLSLSNVLLRLEKTGSLHVDRADPKLFKLLLEKRQWDGPAWTQETLTQSALVASKCLHNNPIGHIIHKIRGLRRLTRCLNIIKISTTTNYINKCMWGRVVDVHRGRADLSRSHNDSIPCPE